MRIEAIFCPACRHKLRIPEDLLGTEVQCPECKAQFVAPPPAPGPAADPAEPPRVFERYDSQGGIDSRAQLADAGSGARNLEGWVTVAGILQAGASGLGLVAAAFRFVLAY